MTTDYERWKNGDKKIRKFPWVIKYYESVTDLNQYKHSEICTKRAMMFIGASFFIFGLYIGFIIWGF